MRKPIQCLCAALFLFFAVGSAQALVINFDDISVPAGYTDVPTDYAGFTWTDFEVLTETFYQTTYANTYGFPSETNAAFNEDGILSLSLQSGTDFDFQGASFSSFFQSDLFQPWSARTVTVYGYKDGNPVGSSASLNLSSTGFDWLQADLLGIDELVIQSDVAERWWIMDNFTYQPVPEPATLLMLGCGLVGLAGYSRRKILNK